MPARIRTRNGFGHFSSVMQITNPEMMKKNCTPSAPTSGHRGYGW